jgi:nucleotidyltransferase substrate binding protein (TIGR01987 family)
MQKDIRWKQRFDNFVKAFLMLKEFIDKGMLNKLEEQGLIKCFEYTFELSWKVMKDFLEDSGYDIKSPREAIQTAFKTELIADGHTWIDTLEKRNLMAHTYNEKTAKEALALIKDKYFKIIEEFYLIMRNK